MSDVSEKFIKLHKAKELARCFRNEFIARGYGYKIYPLNKVDETQWWKYFIEAVDKWGNHSEWDEVLFVRSIFDEYGKIYPHIFSRKSTWDNYLCYLPTYKNNTKTLKDELALLIQDYKNIKKIMEKRNISTYASFFEDELVRDFINRGSFSGNLFIFMKSYYKNYSDIYRVDKDWKEVYEKDRFKRRIFLSNEKVKKVIKKILEDEMVVK